MTSRKTARFDALALAALLAFASPAVARAAGAYDYDANHDGYVSRDEWRRLGGDERVFGGSDADHDGRLDRDEIVKAMSWDERIKAAEYAGDAWITTSGGVESSIIFAEISDGRLTLPTSSTASTATTTRSLMTTHWPISKGPMVSRIFHP